MSLDTRPGTSLATTLGTTAAAPRRSAPAPDSRAATFGPAAAPRPPPERTGHRGRARPGRRRRARAPGRPVPGGGPVARLLAARPGPRARRRRPGRRPAARPRHVPATSGQLRDQRRALEKVETRTSRQDATLRRQPEVRSTVETAVNRLGNRLQATQNLFALVAPRGPVPSMVGYVASPDVLLVLVQKFLTLRPSLTIECGSGTSTLFLALAAQQHGVPGRIVSLENNREYAEGTRALLAEHGVGHLAEVRYAPLTPTTLPDHEGSWYDPAALEDLHDIGLAFVDGPPGSGGPQARYPMVPLLARPLRARLRDRDGRRQPARRARRHGTVADPAGRLPLPVPAADPGGRAVRAGLSTTGRGRSTAAVSVHEAAGQHRTGARWTRTTGRPHSWWAPRAPSASGCARSWCAAGGTSSAADRPARAARGSPPGPGVRQRRDRVRRRRAPPRPGRDLHRP